MYRYVFGPVLSGRLGRSLGLDLLGAKVCSMDCVYCEVGPTTVRTRERRTWVPPRDLLEELAAWKAEGHPAPDAVTLGGSGEPLLNSGLAEIIAGCRRVLPGTPVAVLTNATILDDPVARAEVCGADIILPSLDSLVEREFRAVNRPLQGITAAGTAQGILDLRREFRGRIFLEVLLVRGYNDSGENLALLREYCAELRPDRVDVVTLSRPGTLTSAEAVDSQTLGLWRKALGRNSGAAAPSAPLPRQAQALDEARLQGTLAATLARRPQTVLQLVAALGVEEAQLRKLLARMTRDGEISSAESEGRVFYSATRRP